MKEKHVGNPNVSLCISNEKGGLEERSVHIYISYRETKKFYRSKFYLEKRLRKRKEKKGKSRNFRTDSIIQNKRETNVSENVS